MLDDCPFLSAVFFLVLSVYCLLLSAFCLLLSAFCFLTFPRGGTILKIAIMLGFWYSEVNFQGMIKTGVKEFKIEVEN
jgi:hypothetical protein